MQEESNAMPPEDQEPPRAASLKSRATCPTNDRLLLITIEEDYCGYTGAAFNARGLLHLARLPDR